VADKQPTQYVQLGPSRFQLVRRYASEDRQWPRDIPHPSGKRPIVVDLVLQELHVDRFAKLEDIMNGTAKTQWRDVPIAEHIEGLPEDHDGPVTKPKPYLSLVDPANPQDHGPDIEP